MLNKNVYESSLGCRTYKGIQVDRHQYAAIVPIEYTSGFLIIGRLSTEVDCMHNRASSKTQRVYSI